MLEKLQAIVADKLGVEESEVRPEASFSEDLGADSLDLFEVVMGIEEGFGITVDNDDLSKIQTVQDALDYIAERQ